MEEEGIMLGVGRVGFWLWWVLASTVGWAVGGTGGVAVSLAVCPSRDIIVGGYVGLAVGGIGAGVLQWLVLRRQVAGAGWWVLASTVGWVMSIPVVGLVGWLVGNPVAGLVGGRMAGIVGDAPSWAMLGAVYGAMSGPVLAWLLRQ